MDGRTSSFIGSKRNYGSVCRVCASMPMKVGAERASTALKWMHARTRARRWWWRTCGVWGRGKVMLLYFIYYLLMVDWHIRENMQCACNGAQHIMMHLIWLFVCYCGIMFITERSVSGQSMCVMLLWCASLFYYQICMHDAMTSEFCSYFQINEYFFGTEVDAGLEI